MLDLEPIRERVRALNFARASEDILALIGEVEGDRGRKKRAEDERDAWMQTAKQHCCNEEYYRGLVVSIGQMFGDAARIADDGTVMEDVLCAKVLELVAAGQS